MIQKFSSPYSGKFGPKRLGELRAQMTAADVNGFIIPRSDMHQGEEVTDHDNRLSWLSGFTGSAGFCAVLRRKAGIFVDGRYRIQVRSETHDSFTPVDWPETTLSDWLIEELGEGDLVAFDPWLHSYREISALEGQLAKSGISLHPSKNLIDLIWADQPDQPENPMIIHPLEFSGESYNSKRARLGKQIKDKNIDAAVLTTLDSVAWLTNTRGSDLIHMPVALATAILFSDGRVEIFTDPEKVTSQVKAHLGDETVVRPISLFESKIGALQGNVLLDPQTVPHAVWKKVDTREEGEVTFGDDPTVLPRACKNPIEIAGSKSAHIRDAVAMVRFFHWLDGMDIPTLSEIDIVKKLEGFRREGDMFQTISFETISGSGPNGAIVHYRVDDFSNRKLKADDLLLIDSGGQYRDGTTDITRTIAIGPVTSEQKQANTAVLKGMIAISEQRFPEGTTGAQLDPIARAPLWDEGLDYAHGTGHGVGSFLSVHEGPQRISKTSDQELHLGMILSNEPGFYKEGSYGIRIENLIYVVDTGQVSISGARIFAFETLTLVPFDRNLIDLDALNDMERAWLNVYHETVLQKIGKLVPADVENWLSKACLPI
ncbi:MAG: aminopeptidase P family protein [Pseudomonadota bacterium]